MKKKEKFLNCVSKHNKLEAVKEIYKEFGAIGAPSMYEITKIIHGHRRSN